ncbi:hypothetical protein Bca101_005548 [Brassica carinata]
MSNLPNFHSSSGVDVIRAHILFPTDGQGTAKAFVLSLSSYPSRLHYLALEAQAYSHNRPTYGRSFRSKNRGISSPVRGEIGLKVYIPNEASLKSYAAAPTHPDNLDPAQPTSTY